MWSQFSAVAQGNPYAWSRTALSAAEISLPTPDNRMISLPYPKLMNSNNMVNQAAAIVLCSVKWPPTSKFPGIVGFSACGYRRP